MRGLLKDLDRREGGRWSYLIGTESMLSGAGAGLVSSVVTCPLDVVKTKLQAQGAHSQSGATSYRGLIGTVKTIWKEERLRGLYRGLGPTIFGYLPTWAIYFTVYDQAKPRYAALRPGAGENDVVAHILAAVTAGLTSTTATNPLWVIKTRFMTQRIAGADPNERYHHTLQAFFRIWSEEGIRGFYRGLVPSLIGVSHVVIQFPLYEQIKIHYRKQDGPDLRTSHILVASSVSKMLASVVTYPHEVIRTRLQIQRRGPPDAHNGRDYRPRPGAPPNGLSAGPYPGVIGIFKEVLRTDGPSGMYRGMGVNLLRTVPNSALTILTYELLMRNLTHLTGSANPPR